MVTRRHTGVPHYTEESCMPVRDVLGRVGDKWSVLTIQLLGSGSMRFTELLRLIDGISQRMLTRTLRGLERDGLVKRTVYPTVPPKVEYELTELGQSLRVPIDALGKWAIANAPVIAEARQRYDASASVLVQQG